MIPENDQLLNNIIQQTVGLQCQFAFKMAEKITKEADDKIELEMQRKKEITLANQALDEVKAFHEVLYIFIIRLYLESVRPQDLKALNEDIQRLVIDTMICNEVYNILVFLMRIDTFDSDKDMRNKYSLLKGVKTTDFGIDEYLNMNDPLVLVEELSKLSGIQIETDRELLLNPTLQNFEIEEIVNIEFKEYFKNNMQYINNLPSQLQNILFEKSKIKPYKKSVQRFRQIMLNSCSPLHKMFQLQELLYWQIPNEISEYWKGAIKNESKLVINRDEYISIMLFIIIKAQIPDLMTQLKFIKEFTSEDIQSSEKGYQLSDTFIKFFSTVQWISSLDASQLEDKSYLLKANVQIKEEEDTIRYDRIRFQEGSDRYDPFSIAGGSFLEKNSYIDIKTFLEVQIRE